MSPKSDVFHIDFHVNLNLTSRSFKMFFFIKKLLRSPGPKSHMNYSHHLASVIVVHGQFFKKISETTEEFSESWYDCYFKKSFPLTLLNWLELNLVLTFLSAFCLELICRFSIRLKTWPPLLNNNRIVLRQWCSSYFQSH